MSKVTAIIHVSQRSRFVPGRYGQFVRPDGQSLHLWMGRELSIAEFNEQWPKAVKSVPDTVHVQIIERPDEEIPAEEMILKTEHDKALAAVQEGVNEFTKQCNEVLARKDSQIAELKQALASASTPTVTAEEKPVIEAEKPDVDGADTATEKESLTVGDPAAAAKKTAAKKTAAKDAPPPESK